MSMEHEAIIEPGGGQDQSPWKPGRMRARTAVGFAEPVNDLETVRRERRPYLALPMPHK